MKAFLISVAVFCVWGILLSVLAYATGNLPTPVHLRPIAQQTDQDCSPCAENLAAVLDLVGQDWERDMALFFEQPQKPSKPAAHSWGGYHRHNGRKRNSSLTSAARRKGSVV